MKTLLTLLCLLTLPALRAQTLADFIRARPDVAGDVRKLEAALTAPAVALVTNQVDRLSALDERRIRQTVVPELMTRTEWDELRDEARERRVKRLLEQRILGATNDAQRVSAMYLERRLAVQVERVVRDGGEPWGAASEQARRIEVIQVPGPSWWQTYGKGLPVPPKDELRAALRAASAPTPRPSR